MMTTAAVAVKIAALWLTATMRAAPAAAAATTNGGCSSGSGRIRVGTPNAARQIVIWMRMGPLRAAAAVTPMMTSVECVGMGASC